MNSVIVKKFGGTSVGSIERIQNLAIRLQEDYNAGQKPVVVVSAMSGETNRLIELGHQIDSTNRGPAYDMLVATGEQVSVALLSMALNKLGLSAKPLLAYQIGIETDSLYSKARIQQIRTEAIENAIGAGLIPVIAGFQGVDAELNITTLGRGGSDTSAVAIAAALKCDHCEIYTDVPAVFSADPRLVPRARELAKISFEEMMEMASLGSKVLHIRSVEIGAKHGVKIHLRSTFEKREGTWIVPERDIMQTLEQPVVTSVTHDPNTIIVDLIPAPAGSKFLSDFFTALSRKGVSIDIISQNKLPEGQRLSFSVTAEDLPLTKLAIQELESAGILQSAKVSFSETLAKLSIVGVGMRNHPGVAARFFTVLSKLNVQIRLVTTSEIKVSAVINNSDLKAAAEAMHSEFSLDRI